MPELVCCKTSSCFEYKHEHICLKQHELLLKVCSTALDLNRSRSMISHQVATTHLFLIIFAQPKYGCKALLQASPIKKYDFDVMIKRRQTNKPQKYICLPSREWSFLCNLISGVVSLPNTEFAQSYYFNTSFSRNYIKIYIISLCPQLCSHFKVNKILQQ